jgi:hypothetical protein
MTDILLIQRMMGSPEPPRAFGDFMDLGVSGD